MEPRNASLRNRIILSNRPERIRVEVRVSWRYVDLIEWHTGRAPCLWVRACVLSPQAVPLWINDCQVVSFVDCDGTRGVDVDYVFAAQGDIAGVNGRVPCRDRFRKVCQPDCARCNGYRHVWRALLSTAQAVQDRVTLPHATFYLCGDWKDHLASHRDERRDVSHGPSPSYQVLPVLC